MAAKMQQQLTQQQRRAEPMNASPHHSKVKTSLAFSDPFYIAGGAITGKMELEVKTDKNLGISVIMVELVAIEELTSRDHSATSTFLRTRRIYQGPGVPPSNAVLPHLLAGETPLPANYYPARKGITSFLFNLPIPAESPSSIDFGKGLAKVKYEVRATVGVVWKGEKRLVTDVKEVDVVERFDTDFERVEPEGVVVGEQGKLWLQARVVGGLIVSGESACVELQVKNHSAKKTTGLSIALTRHLRLPDAAATDTPPPLEITDTLTTVNFRGPEYIVQPGTEGVAQLVFDVPRKARTVHGGGRRGDDAEMLPVDALFEVRCTVNIKVSMPIGSKDIYLDLPVTIFHPATLPPPDAPPEVYPPLVPYGSPPRSPVLAPYPERAVSPYAYPISPHMHPMPPLSPAPHHPMTPQPHLPLYHPAHYALGQLWAPPPLHPATFAHPHAALFSPPPDGYHLHNHPPPHAPPPLPPRPSSAEPVASQQMHSLPSGLPPSTGAAHPALAHGMPSAHARGPSSAHAHGQPPGVVVIEAEREEGKGERASRVAQHLRMSSRHRSASPPSHRFGVSADPPLSDERYAAGAGEASLRRTPTTAAALAAQSFRPFRGAPRPSLGALPPANFEVASPRPMPSPKMAQADPFAQSLGKTERVAVLEALAARAAEEDMSHGDVRGLGLELELELGEGDDADLAARMREVGLEPDFEPRPANDKTLPGPPVPSTKPTRSPARSPVNALFPARAPALDVPVPEPKTPTLSALSLLKPPTARRESGLDALERRLAAEVGTRKIEAPPRPDVRAVLSALALDIPSGSAGSTGATRGGSGGADDTVNDSAISSLSLGAECVREHAREHELRREARAREWEHAREEREEEDEHDSEGRTHKGRNGSNSHSDESDRRTARHRERERERERRSDRERDSHRTGTDKERDSRRSDKDKERDSRRSDKKRRSAKRGGATGGDREREEEAARLRRAAKGRIAAWLGGVDADVPDSAVVPVDFTSESPPAGSPALEAIKRQASAQTLVLPPPVEERAVWRKDSAQELKVERKTSAQELRINDRKPSVHDLRAERRPSAALGAQERRLSDAKEHRLSVTEEPKTVERKTSAQDLRIERRLSAAVVVDGATLAATDRKVERKPSAELKLAAQGDKTVERKTSARDLSAARPPIARRSSAQDLAVDRPATPRKPSADDVKKAERAPPSPKPDTPTQRPVVIRQLTEDDPAKDTVRAPNPRSSGFVPMATLRARKAAEADDTPHASPRQAPAQANPRARWEAALQRNQVLPPVDKADKPIPRRLSSAGQRAPLFQQQLVGEPKYDVRSARGGRGGKVTAVTALWANVVQEESAASASSPALPKVSAPAPKPKPKPAKPQALMKGMGGVKARTAPSMSTAAVSSSHARPTLSSTASLSRPAGAPPTPRITRVPPVISEEPASVTTPPVAVKTPAAAASASVESDKPTAPKGDLAFGQARLRDLIRKYQSQAS